jgi:hypothetical protein
VLLAMAYPHLPIQIEVSLPASPTAVGFDFTTTTHHHYSPANTYTYRLFDF